MCLAFVLSLCFPGFLWVPDSTKMQISLPGARVEKPRGRSVVCDPHSHVFAGCSLIADWNRITSLRYDVLSTPPPLEARIQCNRYIRFIIVTLFIPCVMTDCIFKIYVLKLSQREHTIKSLRADSLVGARCWWRSWLTHCSTSRRVAGTIPDGVIGIFQWPNPSGHIMALRLSH